MIFICVDSLDTVCNIARVCNKYNKIDIDVIYGRYIADGKSVFSVCSYLGKIVKIVPITDDNLLINYIIRDLKEIGAWIGKVD